MCCAITLNNKCCSKQGKFKEEGRSYCGTHVSHYEVDVCSICMDYIQKKDCIFTRCSHSFHIKCINKWSYTNDTCPICRHFINSFLITHIDFRMFYNIMQLPDPLYISSRHFSEIILFYNDHRDFCDDHYDISIIWKRFLCSK